MAKRLAWAYANEKRNWSRVMFSDEVTFRLFCKMKRLWKRKGQIKVIRTVKHGPKVNVWGCFSASGFGSLQVISGNLNKEKMLQIYKNGLIPSADKQFGRRNRTWELLEDGDPKHKAKICKTWKMENRVRVMDWPASSPDLNPIENVWSILKRKVCRYKINNASELMSAIRREWNLLSPEYARKLAESCTSRLQSVIDNDGDWTKY